MTGLPPTAREPFWLVALAGAFLAGGPVWQYLYVHHYPFSRPEAVILPLIAAIAGAVVAWGGRRLGPLAGTVAFGGLLYIFVDLQFNLEKSIPSWMVVLGCMLVAAIFRARRSAIACVTLAAFYLAVLPRSGRGLDDELVDAGSGATPVARRAPPLLVHIVLDEQWGVGGLRAAGDTATAAFLRNFYLSRGFELYEGAYSRWGRTTKSLTTLMSLGGTVSTDPAPIAADPDRVILKSNRYFERLAALGYSMSVYQISHIDYCGEAGVRVVVCETSAGNSISSMGYIDGPWRERAERVTRYFLNVTSHLYAKLKSPPDGQGWRMASTGNALVMVESARKALREAHAGEAYFIHILLPHRPLGHDAACRAYSEPAKRVGYDLPRQLTESEWQDLLSLYGAQVRCAHIALASLLDAIEGSVGSNAIVIVHGDHGSRFSRRDPDYTPFSSWDPGQLNSTYATLLAIRRPGVPAARYPEAVPLQDFLQQLVAQDFQGPVESSWVHYVNSDQSTSRRLTPGQMPWAVTAQPGAVLSSNFGGGPDQ